MRNPKLLVTLFLMIMLALTLQAQNHQNNGNGNSHQGNYQPIHPDNNYHPQPVKAYKGILIKQDREDNQHGNGWNGGEQGNHQNNGSNDYNNIHKDTYGIVLNSGGPNGGFHQFDDRGNQLVRAMLRKHQNSHNRMMVQVKGSMGRDGTIMVRSIKWMGRPRNDTGFAMNYDNNGSHRPGWSFDLFVRFP